MMLEGGKNDAAGDVVRNVADQSQACRFGADTPQIKRPEISMVQREI